MNQCKQDKNNKIVDDLKAEIAHLKIKTNQISNNNKVEIDEKCNNCSNLTSKLDKLKNQKCQNCKILNDKLLNLTKLHAKCKSDIYVKNNEIIKIEKNIKSEKDKKNNKENNPIQLRINNYLNISSKHDNTMKIKNKDNRKTKSV